MVGFVRQDRRGQITPLDVNSRVKGVPCAQLVGGARVRVRIRVRIRIRVD